MDELNGKKALVVGASRGLRRGIAEAFDAAGAAVVAVARDGARLAELARSGSGIVAEVADATDPAVARTLLERHRPDVLALVTGAALLPRPLQDHTWESFSANWNSDVRIGFHWLREALLLPLSHRRSRAAPAPGRPAVRARPAMARALAPQPAAGRPRRRAGSCRTRPPRSASAAASCRGAGRRRRSPVPGRRSWSAAPVV